MTIHRYKILFFLALGVLVIDLFLRPRNMQIAPNQLAPFILILTASIVLAKVMLILPENRRAGVFRLGKFFGILKPGLHIILPFVDKVVNINLNEKLPGWQSLSAEQLNAQVKQIILGEMK